MEIREDRYAEAKRLIRQAMREKRLVLFVGAGVSKNSGMPSWDEAIKEFEDKFDFDTFNLGEFSDKTILPQYYYNERGQKEYTQLARKIFRYEDKLKPSDIHKAILKFNVDTIITTNYDHLIEQAGGDSGVFFQVVSQDVDLPYKKGGKELIKMHGDFEHHNFVFKEDDYFHYSKNFKLIENYIKSLIGTKLVLFIGYSLNDPDLKNIISWTKDILGGHFQRAYLIATGRSLNMTEIFYYRNLGVNIIYATELSRRNDHKRQLIDTLEYFLSDDETDLINFLYEFLKPFSVLNYTYCKYVAEGLMEYRRKINKNATIQITNVIEFSYCKKPSAVDELKFMNELYKATNGVSNYSQMKTIFEILRKSSIFDKTHNLKLGGDILDFDNKPDWIKEILFFDFIKLEKRKNQNSKLLPQNKLTRYMEHAYVLAFMSDYENAYYWLDNVSRQFYQNANYIWYFIALWNKYKLAPVIIYKASIGSLKLKKDTFNFIKDDYNSMDLERTLQTIPDLGNSQNQFLKYLQDFKFASDLFSEVVSNSMKVSSDASKKNTVILGMPSCLNIQLQVYDYYYYGIYNYLFVDIVNENNEIFHLFTRSIFASIAASNENSSNNTGIGHLKNIFEIKVDSLNHFDIHLILRYINSADLRGLFNEFNLNLVRLEDSGKKYLEVVIPHIVKVFDLKEYEGKDIFWRCLCLVSHTEIDESIAKIIINALSCMHKKEYMLPKQEFLQEFVNALVYQKLYNNENLSKSILFLAKKLLNLILKEKHLLSAYQNLIVSLISVAKSGGVLFDDMLVINKILNANYYDLALSIYDECSECIKQTIDEAFKKWTCPNTEEGYYIYSTLVLKGIIEKNNETELSALDFLKKRHDERKKGDPSEIVLASRYSLEGCLIDLCKQNKFSNEEKLRDEILNGDDSFSKWLIDVENYDYSKFDLSWLKNCSDYFLQKLANDAEVKGKILSKYKEERQSGMNDKQIDDIVLKHFI